MCARANAGRRGRARAVLQRVEASRKRARSPCLSVARLCGEAEPGAPTLASASASGRRAASASASASQPGRGGEDPAIPMSGGGVESRTVCSGSVLLGSRSPMPKRPDERFPKRRERPVNVSRLKSPCAEPIYISRGRARRRPRSARRPIDSRVERKPASNWLHGDAAASAMMPGTPRRRLSHRAWDEGCRPLLTCVIAPRRAPMATSPLAAPPGPGTAHPALSRRHCAPPPCQRWQGAVVWTRPTPRRHPISLLDAVAVLPQRGGSGARARPAPGSAAAEAMRRAWPLGRVRSPSRDRGPPAALPGYPTCLLRSRQLCSRPRRGRLSTWLKPRCWTIPVTPIDSLSSYQGTPTALAAAC